MSNALKKITTRAKSIRRKHPNMKYTDAVKTASNQLRREGAIGSVKHVKKPVRKNVKVTSKPMRKKVPKAKTQTVHTDSIVKRTVSGTPRKGQLSGSVYSVRSSIERDIAMYNNFIDRTRIEKHKGYKAMLNMAKRRLRILKVSLREQNKLINDLLK